MKKSINFNRLTEIISKKKGPVSVYRQTDTEPKTGKKFKTEQLYNNYTSSIIQHYLAKTKK